MLLYHIYSYHTIYRNCGGFGCDGEDCTDEIDNGQLALLLRKILKSDKKKKKNQDKEKLMMRGDGETEKNIR